MQKARWGAFFHFLADSASATAPASITIDEWNRRVDAFDVDSLTGKLAQAGAGYCFLTVGQNSGMFCSPNATFDAIVQHSPSRISRRDLVADLADAMVSRGLRMGVYVTSGGPENDVRAVERLGWKKGEFRNAEFQRHWEAILREWSLRWGSRVSAWWVDGVYFADAMYRQAEEPNFASFAAAMRAGNPEALLAFNPGCRTQLAMVTPEEDFTAGELDYFLALSGHRDLDNKDFNKPSRTNGKRIHFLGFLGHWWGQGPLRFPDELVAGYTRHINEHGGVVSWDVPLSPTGNMDDSCFRQLCRIGQGGR